MQYSNLDLSSDTILILTQIIKPHVIALLDFESNFHKNLKVNKINLE